MNTWNEPFALREDAALNVGNNLLVALEDFEAMCVALDERGLLTETRSFAGGVRTFCTDRVNRARELRRHDDIDVLPMSLTTRKTG